MAIIKKKTKKGSFLVELGSFKKNKSNESLEEYLNKTTHPNKKVEDAYNIFVNYHLANGSKKRELRLNRTTIKFGRKKS